MATLLLGGIISSSLRWRETEGRKGGREGESLRWHVMDGI